MAGPDTPELAAAAVAGGADLLEIGFPFSDPLADGPVIRLAGERALAQGMRTRRASSAWPRLGPRGRPTDSHDVCVHPRGVRLRALPGRRPEAGATSLIVADLPIEAAPELRRVQLVAPTTPVERIRLAAKRTDGWLYLVSLTGTTGARGEVSEQLAGLVERPAASRTCRFSPASASRRPSTPPRPRPSRTESSSAAEPSRSPTKKVPEALREYVASLRKALDRDAGPPLRSGLARQTSLRLRPCTRSSSLRTNCGLCARRSTRISRTSATTRRTS